MKKNIFAPDVRVIRFDSHDVIVTSNPGNGTTRDAQGFNGSGFEGGYAPERTSLWD